MARVEVPIVVINSATGLPVNGASVSITRRSSGTAATWFTAETGGLGSTAPVVTDANGRVQAWVDRGAYNAQISGTGITTYTEPFDAAAAGDATVDSIWIPDGTIGWIKMNVADGAIPASKIGAGVTSAQLADVLIKQLNPAPQRGFKWGSVNIDGAGFGSSNVGTRAIAHGLGTAPFWVSLTASTANSSSETTDPVVVSILSLDSTNINVRVRTSSGGSINFPGIIVYWLAIA